MSDLVADIAKRAAVRLAPALGSELPDEVAVALQRRDGDAPADHYVVDPVSLGALIIAVAQLGWTIYGDLRTQTPQPAPEVVARRIRVELRASDDGVVVEEAVRDRVIEIVVDETLAAEAAD